MDMIATATVDGRFVDVNPAWYETLGWTSQELTLTPIATYVHPEDIEAMRAATAGLSLGRATASCEARLRAKDERYHWFLWSLGLDAEQGLIYYVAKDITQRRDMEELLRAGERTMRRLVDSNVIGIITTDLDGRVLDANRAFCDMLGRTKDEVRDREVIGSRVTLPEWAT